jgi:hypothetical protein
MTAAETAAMAECLRWLYVESHCECIRCRETRIQAARALAIYEEERKRNGIVGTRQRTRE